MYIGESERNLHEVFELARRTAPPVLFLDEVDALGRRRSQLSSSSGRDLSAQLLAELDGVAADNEGVFVLAATNHPWDVDTALRRPGRLDRTLLVLPPDVEAREAILRYHLSERPVEDDLDVAALARATTRFSGADLAHLCETAAEHALDACLESGVTRGLTARDLALALEEVRPSTGPWLQVARNYAEFGSDGGSSTSSSRTCARPGERCPARGQRRVRVLVEELGRYEDGRDAAREALARFPAAPGWRACSRWRTTVSGSTATRWQRRSGPRARPGVGVAASPARRGVAGARAPRRGAAPDAAGGQPGAERAAGMACAACANVSLGRYDEARVATQRVLDLVRARRTAGRCSPRWAGRPRTGKRPSARPPRWRPTRRS